MYYVNPSEVMRLFKAYLEEYKDMLSKEAAIDELQDALDNAECQWVEADSPEEAAKIVASECPYDIDGEADVLSASSAMDTNI